MPFGAHILGPLEDALSEGFDYHSQLNSFLLRSGIRQEVIDKVRRHAELRKNFSDKGWKQAPKRFVVQEAIRYLSEIGDPGELAIANLITGVCKSNFSKANEKCQTAIKNLKEQCEIDRKEKEAFAREEEFREHNKKQKEEAITKERRATAQQLSRENLRNVFFAISNQADKQARGYALEKFLNELFEFEELKPRTPFKLTGEQIDGSFSWANFTHLVEARWVKNPVAGSGFSSLMYKTSGKSANTRGLFVSINGYSAEALRGLSGKGELRFVCIDGAHLVRALTPGFSLKALLTEIWRHADETGEPYLPVARMLA